MPMRYLGLDLHKQYVHGFVFQPGQKGTHFRFRNTPEGWQRFVATYVTKDPAIALEATGNACAIYDALVAQAG
jgi:transposase